jgi:hypothetical protein
MSPFAPELHISTDNISDLLRGAPFITIQTLSCDNIDFDSLSYIISLFPNLNELSVIYINISQVKLTIPNIILFLTTLIKIIDKKLKVVTIPKIFLDINQLILKEELELTNTNIKTMNLLIDKIKKAMETKQIELTYND